MRANKNFFPTQQSLQTGRGTSKRTKTEKEKKQNDKTKKGQTENKGLVSSSERKTLE